MTHYCGNPLLVFVRTYGLDFHCVRCGRSWAQTEVGE